MEAEIPDIVFLQNFYGYKDIEDLEIFLRRLDILSDKTEHFTEIKIFPAENETEDGKRASNKYGFDLVNWKQLIKNMKSGSFSYENLNYPDDPIGHSNTLAEFAGAILMNMSLYGKIPFLPSDFCSSDYDIWNDLFVYYAKQSSASLCSAPPYKRRHTDYESPLYKEGGTAEQP